MSNELTGADMKLGLKETRAEVLRLRNELDDLQKHYMRVVVDWDKLHQYLIKLHKRTPHPFLKEEISELFSN